MQKLTFGALAGVVLGVVMTRAGMPVGLLFVLGGTSVAIVALAVVLIREPHPANVVLPVLIVIVGGGICLMAALSLHRNRQPSLRGECANYLHQLGKAMSAYMARNADYWPYDARGPLHSLALLYPEYIIDPRIFICPSRRKAESRAFPADCALPNWPCSYGYDHLADPRTQSPDSPRAADMPGNHGADGVNVLYWDGHVSFMPLPDAAPTDDNIFQRTPGLAPDEDAYLHQ